MINRRSLLIGSVVSGITPVNAQYISRGGSGATAGNSSETSQFFDRLVTLPSTSRQTLYAALINGLVTDGVWALLDALYVFAAADSDTSLTNLKQTAFKATLNTSTGNLIFTVDRGWSGGGSGGARDVSTNFNPSTAGGNYTRNNAMFCGWLLGSTQENRTVVGNVAGSDNLEIYPLWSDTKTYWSVNGAEVTSTLGLGTPEGFWLAQRTAAGAEELNRNGTQVATSTNASAALINTNINANALLDINAVLGIGASLTSGQKTSLYTRLQTYLQAVGAV